MTAHIAPPTKPLPELPAGELLPDGVYFGLPEDRYHADPALGSSNVKELRVSPAGYWWKSAYNPLRPKREDKAHLVFGSALHKLVLEGPEAFLALYGRLPDDELLLVTADDLGAWLQEQGVEKLPRTKAERAALALQLDPAVQIKDVLLAEAEAKGLQLLKAEDYDRIVTAGARIAKNPKLASAFRNGAAEVSLFWTIDVDGVAVRCKARFDYLKVGGIGDLKSFRNTKGVKLQRATTLAVAGWDYAMQAKHYLNARAALPALVAAGRVWGEHDPAWLARVAAAPTYAFQWVFFQATDAPSVDSQILSPENPIAEAAQAQLNEALWNFRACFLKFGLAEEWVEDTEPREISIEEMPAYWGRE